MKAVAVLLVIAGTLAGCTWVEQADENTIRIGMGDLGILAPGLRRPVTWPEAREHCAGFGKEATLIDLRGKTAIWRCDPTK